MYRRCSHFVRIGRSTEALTTFLKNSIWFVTFKQYRCTLELEYFISLSDSPLWRGSEAFICASFKATKLHSQNPHCTWLNSEVVGLLWPGIESLSVLLLVTCVSFTRVTEETTKVTHKGSDRQTTRVSWIRSNEFFSMEAGGFEESCKVFSSLAEGDTECQVKQLKYWK